MTRADEPSPELHADVAALEAEIEREGARVGVDWEEAAPAMRTLARARRRRLTDDEFEVDLEHDVSGMLAALRTLPDAAGTAAFVAAFRHQQRAAPPPPP